jgi:hypothetical protein
LLLLFLASLVLTQKEGPLALYEPVVLLFVGAILFVMESGWLKKWPAQITTEHQFTPLRGNAIVFLAL